GSGRVEGLRLSDGSIVEAGLVVVGIGSVPRTDWLEGSGVGLGDGILCDERMAVEGVEDVFALGDVARWRNPRYRGSIRAENWTNVADQARAIAANLCGEPTACNALPYFWSTQYGGRLQVAGRIAEGDEVRMIGGAGSPDRFVALAGSSGGGVSA